jgi:hypothetical protein
VQQQRKEEALITDPTDPAIPNSRPPPHQKEEKISQYTDKNNELHD